MENKVKRGLGLLVVALIAWLGAMALMQVDAVGGVAGALTLVLSMALALAFLVGLVGGLALLAWGLLRD